MAHGSEYLLWRDGIISRNADKLFQKFLDSMRKNIERRNFLEKTKKSRYFFGQVGNFIFYFLVTIFLLLLGLFLVSKFIL
jgi:hypothetical protein